jgi:uncharacterized delta-60 repeat protein
MNRSSARRNVVPTLIACLLTLLAIAGFSQPASAAGVILDATYSPGGLSGDGVTGYGNPVGTKQNTKGKAVAVQTDGKVVVAGTYDLGGGDTDAVVLRYNVDGTPDNTFGNTFLADGTTRVFSWGGGGADKANALAIQPDGKIVVVGTYDFGAGNTNIWVMRLNSDGTFDTSFNGKGELVFKSSGADSGNAVAIDKNNKIVVAGTDNVTGGISFAWVARLNSNGTYDNTFNPIDANNYGNVAISGDTGENGVANAVAIQADNKIVITGSKEIGGGNTSLWVVRLTTGGVLDTTFHSTGDRALGSNGKHVGNAVAIDSIGRIVVVGTYDWTNITANSAQKTDLWVQRLNSDGSDDTSFFINGGTGGSTYGGTGLDKGTGVTIQPDGMLLLVGTADLGSGNSGAVVMRLKSNGQPSNTFNNGQSSYMLPGTGAFAGSAVALQNGTEIIVAGTGYVNGGLTSTVMTFRLHGTTNRLQVTITGNGTVNANIGSLLYAGNVGEEYYFPNEVVTLTAVPSTGNSFSAWGGACAGTLTITCAVTMSDAKDVTATFAPIVPQLTVNIVNNGNAPSFGTGTVLVNPPNTTFNNGSYQHTYSFDTPVTLTASPSWHSVFSGWSGDACNNTTAPCTVTMNSASKAVNAIFAPNYRVLLTAPGTKLYSTINNDYLADFPGAQSLTILLQAFAFPETLDYNVALTTNLLGGKDIGFQNDVGYSTINSPFKIRAGRMNVKNVKVH